MKKTCLCASKAGTEEEQSSYMPERQEAAACKHSRDGAGQRPLMHSISGRAGSRGNLQTYTVHLGKGYWKKVGRLTL